MQQALIGHTGFVGSILRRSFTFRHLFNSANSDDMRGLATDHVVCCGASSVKWLANQDPEKDAAHVQALIDNLRQVNADRLTLISTVDVYPETGGRTEKHVPFNQGHHAYGFNRRRLEEAVADAFPNVRILRLPALFGPGLKKNVLYDLMTGNQIEKIDPYARFQWYDLARLASDILIAWDLDTTETNNIVHLVPEPVSTWEIARAFFPHVELPHPGSTQPVKYHLRSVYDTVFGGEGGYIMDKNAVLGRMAGFLARQRRPVDEVMS